MRVNWIKGQRTTVTGTDGKGKKIVRKGKKGGPMIKQEVTKVMIPKGAA